METGTNEFEIMEFSIAGELFGINVDKVLEIMVSCPVKPMQKSHPDVEGIFKSRDMVITVIDLARHLGLPPSGSNDKDIFIITNFNDSNFAFHVHTVVGINRISWSQVKKPDKVVYGGGQGAAAGIADHDGRLITILDFEKVVAGINPQLGHSVMPVLVAEDSTLLSKMITEHLNRAGYNNIIKLDNGQEAWDYLQEAKESGDDLQDHAALLISGIEMPQMDGLRLTKLVKGDPALERLPVILCSSLISEELRAKGEEAGADAQISKPEMGDLAQLVDRFLRPEKE